ncbi:putative alkaline shock family protein YloU [Pseudonocardia sediminis]|uniref:Putative alkaline shock family protein YloU n=1 Tax=Pseudonocardia sediminis TaxID=1397368 RepID=A0A4V2FRK9_PSEST|nr:Asp23/Gls24 family envelope stress response protein [Pseudonocardia sediminis]RZT89030.1 putative alkaline shock family protein YloU [Pseudonocardia sediminis]
MSTPSASSPARPTPGPATGDAALVTSNGNTRIAEAVVSKIAGLATREVHGVHDLGGGAARAFGAIRERIPGASTNASQGISVEVGEKQAAVDINLVVEYGVAIADLAKAVRRNVISALERMTGLQVVEVNISVDDVYLPSDDDDQPARPESSARVA